MGKNEVKSALFIFYTTDLKTARHQTQEVLEFEGYTGQEGIKV